MTNKLTSITLVTRQFTKNAKPNDFKKKEFIKEFKSNFFTPLNNLTKNAKNIKKIVVIFCGDQESEWAEKYNEDDENPASYSCLHQLIGSPEYRKDWKINNIQIVPVICTNWGANAGSATALNDGLKEVETELVLIWSKEMPLLAHNVNEAISLVNQEDLVVVGFLREGWENKNAWNVPQNTAAIWNTSHLKSINGFSKICNGGLGDKVTLKSGIAKDVAGMEDMEALMRLVIINSNYKYAMLGKKNPIKSSHGKEEYTEAEKTRNSEKTERQPLVLQKYFDRLDPGSKMGIEAIIYKNLKIY